MPTTMVASMGLRVGQSENLDNFPSPENQDSDLDKSLPPPVKVRAYSEGEIVNIKVDTSRPPRMVSPSEMVKQHVQTPDGKVHIVFVPQGHELKAGAMLSESYFKNPLPSPPDESFNRQVRKADIPEGEDAESYLQKLSYASAYGVSVEEVERMMENGQIQTKVIARSVEEVLDYNYPYHSHEHETPSGDETSPISAGPDSFEDIGNPPAYSEVPPIMLEPKTLVTRDYIRPGDEHVHETSPEVQGWEGLSSEQQEQAKQFFDQYGSEEGLRRLREMNPEAARRFERERRKPPVHSEPDDESSTR